MPGSIFPAEEALLISVQDDMTSATKYLQEILITIQLAI
jgi:hypothetical protein